MKDIACDSLLTHVPDLLTVACSGGQGEEQGVLAHLRLSNLRSSALDGERILTALTNASQL